MSQRDTGERFRDVPFLGAWSFQKLLSHRRIVKQLPDFDRGTHWRANRFDGFVDTAIDSEFVTAIVVVGPRANNGLADFCDRRQRLAAKTERADFE